jgi:LacI family transcriptional regulator
MSKPLLRPVTLKNVAMAAGVSYQTVSRAVNGYAEIHPDTRQRILQIAEELGYRPNRLAGSLRSAYSKVIGLIVSDIENGYFAEVAAGVEAEATAEGYSVILANTGEDIARERAAVTSLFERRVDGLVIAPAEGDHAFLETDLPRSFPVVAFNRMLPHPRYGAVLSENEAGAQMAVEHLIARGHRKIGAIVASPSLITSRERLNGFRSAMRAANLPIKPEWVATGTIYPEGARLAASKIFAGRDHPTGLLTSSQRITEGVLLALRKLGLKHGRDVDIVGFDNFPWAALLEPPLTLVAQETHQIGRQAVRMLLGMIAGTSGPSTVRLPTRLVARPEIPGDPG